MDIKHNDSAITYMGRVVQKEEATYFNYTCSGFCFKFRGKKILAQFKCDLIYENNKPLNPWLAVIIDGNNEPSHLIELDGTDTWYTLYESNEEEEHSIEVLKRTEAQHSKTGLIGLKINGNIEELPIRKPYKIEFVGDSITCGYGNETIKPEDGFRTDQENGLKTYAALGAKYFDAAYNCISVSGIGIYSSYTEQNSINDTLLMSKLYGYTDYLFEKNNVVLWDFKKFVPDLIVVNLGTNDYSYVLFDMKQYGKAFVQAYKKFIMQIRDYNGEHVPILCALGSMRTDMFPFIEEAVELYKMETGDCFIETMTFTNQIEGDGIGGSYHPTIKTHEKMAKELRDKIVAWLGWRIYN